jgi:hypothetical protein
MIISDLGNHLLISTATLRTISLLNNSEELRIQSLGPDDEAIWKIRIMSISVSVTIPTIGLIFFQSIPGPDVKNKIRPFFLKAQVARRFLRMHKVEYYKKISSDFPKKNFGFISNNGQFSPKELPS